MKRWFTVVGALALVAALLVVVLRPGSPPEVDDAAHAGGDHPATPVIVDADAHGAIILDIEAREMVGVDAAGAVRWRDRELADRIIVSCLAQCPDAVGSGGADTGSTPPVIWRTGDLRRVDEHSAEVVLWAQSADDAIVKRTEAGHDLIEVRTPEGRQPHPIDGTDTQLFAAPDDSRAVVVADTGAYFALDRRSGGWTVSSPGAAAARSACLGRGGHPTVLFDSDHTYLADPATARPRELPVTNVGRCAVGTDVLVVQRFRDHTRTGPHTTTRVLDSAGLPRWERTDPGINPGDFDAESGLLALRVDDELLVLDLTGTPVHRLTGFVDMRFVGKGRLLVLRSDAGTAVLDV